MVEMGVTHLNNNDRFELIHSKCMHLLLEHLGLAYCVPTSWACCSSPAFRHGAVFTELRFEPIVYALRGIIDQNRDKMRVLYTGSSRSGLQQLFKRRNAPMFSSSQPCSSERFNRRAVWTWCGYRCHLVLAYRRCITVLPIRPMGQGNGC